MEEAKKRNFFAHVFNFEDDSRHEMMNVTQYSLLATVFVAVLNKIFEMYMPEPEKDKGTPALALETALQIILTFLGLILIHRIIEFIPTFSGTKYGTYNMIPVILPVLVVLLSLNSGVGRKVAMIFDKVTSGSPPPKQTLQQHQQQQQQQQQPNSMMNQLLPQGMNTMSNPMKAQSAIPGPPADPDYGGMFSSSGEFEPVAANMGGVSLF
jgi:hypothetical protein